MTYSNEQFERRFRNMMSYHPVRDEAQKERYSTLRQLFQVLAGHVNEQCPDGYAKNDALNHLEIALMRSTQAIACGEDTDNTGGN